MTAAVHRESIGSANPVSEKGLYRVGPVVIRQGIARKNVRTLFFVSFFGIAMMNTVGILQAYLFNEMLKIPANEQGRLTGWLLVEQELVVILLSGLAGALSDKIGRARIFSIGFMLLAIGYSLYPLASGSGSALVYELVAFRLFLASGVTCVSVMLSAVANDYTIDRTRAKMIAGVFICNGLGIAALPVFLLGPMPKRLVAAGIDPILAGRFTYWLVAAICLVLALIVLWGLKSGAPRERTGERQSMLETLRIGVQAAKLPRVALGYAAAFVSRADLAVVSTFLTAWLVIEGKRQGLSGPDALLKATIFYGIIQFCAIPWAAVFGYILDRVDRVTGLMIGMCVAFVGYAVLGLLSNPLGWQMYAAAVAVGAGEMAANISATSLIGKEAPEEGRGAVLGLYNLFGALGIMVVGIVGGWLFDHWNPVGPFVYMAASNVVLLMIAAAVFVNTRKNLRGEGGTHII